MKTILATLLALATTTLAFADPLACSGICTNTHDPSIIERASDGTYFRFATGGTLGVHSAPGIQGPWTYQGQVLEGTGIEDAWAPDVQQLPDGSFVCYYSVSTFGTQESWIGVATSSSLDAGTWVDHGATGLSSTAGDPYNAIDANLFQTPGVDQRVLTFGSFWTDIFQTTGVTGDGLTVFGDAPTNVQFNGSGTQAAEGPYLFQPTNSQYYYLFFSSGICCGYDAERPAPGEEYKIMVCRASSPTGPFVDAEGRACTDGGGTLVLGSHGVVYGPGGQGVLGGTEAGDVLYYHYVDTTVGYADGDKRLGVSPIDWSSGWPVV